MESTFRGSALFLPKTCDFWMEDRTVFFYSNHWWNEQRLNTYGHTAGFCSGRGTKLCAALQITRLRLLDLHILANGSATINFYANVADGAWSTGAAKGINRAAFILQDLIGALMGTKFSSFAIRGV